MNGNMFSKDDFQWKWSIKTVYIKNTHPNVDCTEYFYKTDSVLSHSISYTTNKISMLSKAQQTFFRAMKEKICMRRKSLEVVWKYINDGNIFRLCNGFCHKMC